MQHTFRHADHSQRRRVALDQGNLDMLAAALSTLSDTELETLIARLDAASEPTWAAAIRRMSNEDLDLVVAELAADALIHASARK